MKEESCPKCGSEHLSPPQYRASRGVLPEGLLYKCGTCGYSWRGQTLDQKKRAEAAKQKVSKRRSK